MAFKMAHSSLFSILLRSPWWYSALIAFLITTVSTMVAGSKYLIFGLAASVPFIGIAAVSAYRQLNRPSKQRQLEVLRLARNMPPRELAARIAVPYRKQRYEVTSFKGNGADIELTRGSRKLLLSTRRFKAATTGIEPLKLLVSAGDLTEATGTLYVTLGEVSENGRRYAKDNDIELIQLETLTALFDEKAVIE